MKKIIAVLAAGCICTAACGCAALRGLRELEAQSSAQPTVQYTEYETFEVPDAPAETVSPVNLAAVENFAASWNTNFANDEKLQFVPSEAVAEPGDGMLLGGQILEYVFAPGRLFLYVLEGQLIGARMETNTNSWADPPKDARDWNICWKTMIQSVNGNWVDTRYADIINAVSEGFPPAGQEDGSLEGEVITDNGWVYEMVNVDLGYEYEKEVSAWLAHFAGAHA